MASKIFLIIFLVCLFLSPGWAQDTLTMIQLDPLSGPFKEVGELSIAGVQFLVDEVNTAGGLLGKKIKYMPEDSQLKPDVAVRKANKAILKDNAKIILQLNSTAVARTLMDVAEKNKVLFLTLGTESDFLTGKDFNPYFFRTCFTMANRSKAYAEFFKTRPWRKFYLINMDYAFGHAVANDFKSTLKKEIPDLRILGEDFHPLATKDFRPYLTKILASGAEIIFTGNWGKDMEVLIRQGSQMGVNARYATYFLDDRIHLSSVGQFAVGSFVNSAYFPTIETPQNKAFLERWNKKNKDTKDSWPTAHIGYGYNGVKFLFEAIKKAESFDADEVIRAWEGMEYNSLIGKQVMRACDHQIMMPGFVAEIQAKSALFPFPFPGTPVIFPMDKVAVPIKETGNARCK